MPALVVGPNCRYAYSVWDLEESPMRHLDRLNSSVLALPIGSDCRDRSGRLSVCIRVYIA